MKSGREKLTTSAQTLFTKMYEQAAAAQQAAGAGAGSSAGANPDMGASSGPQDDNVVDGDFKEV